MKTCGTFTKISRWIIFRMRNVSDKTCREIQNTNLCSIPFS